MADSPYRARRQSSLGPFRRLAFLVHLRDLHVHRLVVMDRWFDRFCNSHASLPALASREIQLLLPSLQYDVAIQVRHVSMVTERVRLVEDRIVLDANIARLAREFPGEFSASDMSAFAQIMP